MPADVIDQIIRDADPLRDAEPAAGDALTARRVLRAAKRSSGRTGRRAALVGVAAVVALGAAAVGVRRDGHPGTSDQVVCEASPVADGTLTFDARTDDPIRECRDHWKEIFFTAAPARLTACVDGSAQGSIKVYPGGALVCADHRAVPYQGPTDEQRRFADFLEAAKGLRDREGDPCISYPQLHAAIDRLLAEHQLTGWTYGRPNGPQADCATVIGFDEPKRVVITN